MYETNAFYTYDNLILTEKSICLLPDLKFELLCSIHLYLPICIYIKIRHAIFVYI